MTRWRTCVVYARISKEDDQSTEQQVDLLMPWAQEQTASKVVVVAEEMSSRKVRPKLEYVRRQLLAGHFDAIVVWKLDRIGRSAEELLRWRRECGLVGYDLVSYSQNIDISVPEGRFTFGMLALMAEYERDVISQRTKFKLDYLKKLGRPTGRARQVVVGKNEAGGDILKWAGAVADEAKARDIFNTHTVRSFALALGISRAAAGRLRQRLEAEAADKKLRPADPLTALSQDELIALARKWHLRASEARGIARVLSHAYMHDSRPPREMIDEAIGYPVTPEELDVCMAPAPARDEVTTNKQ